MVEVKKKKWQTLCSSEWPTFNVGWPQDSTFNIDVILQDKEWVFSTGPHGHPDQVHYTVTWESLAQDPPPWVAPFMTKTPKPPDFTALVPTAPLAQSSLYPILEKEKSEARSKPVIPLDDSVLIDLLSEDLPSYQDTPVPIPPATSPEVCSPDITNPVAEEGAASPSFAETRLHLHKDLREEG